ncbi:hypothetical protein ABG067_004360 [Albugo candida]
MDIMQFYMEEESRAIPQFKRCWPDMEIEEEVIEDETIGNILYRINLRGNGDNGKKHYNPEVGGLAKPIFDSTITGSWTIILKLMEILNNKGMMTYWTNGKITLDPEKFLKMAPKGIYTFTQERKSCGIQHALDSEANDAEDRKFKSENDFRLPSIKVGDQV